MFTNKLRQLGKYGRLLNTLAEDLDIDSMKALARSAAQIAMSPEDSAVTDDSLAEMIKRLAGAKDMAMSDEAQAWYPPIDKPTLVACLKTRYTISIAYHLVCLVRIELKWQRCVKAMQSACAVAGVLILLAGIYGGQVVALLIGFVIATEAILDCWNLFYKYDFQTAAPKEAVMADYGSLRRLDEAFAAA